ncbi:MAG: ABC transporter ATP-binding protein [Candidatus Thermoplasmatota archaeon]
MLLNAVNVSKKYGEKKALDSVSLDVREGEIFGLFGPNGAGKTTFIRVCTGITQFYGGHLTVCGVDVRRRPKDVRNFVSILTEEPKLYGYMTPFEYLRFFSGLACIKEPEKYVDEVLRIVEIENKKNEKIYTLSLGQRQRIEIARVFLSPSYLLFLDEPFGNIDIELRKKLRDYLKLWVGKDKAIFYTSHNLIESEYIVDRFALICNGRIILIGNAKELKEKYLQPTYFIETKEKEKAENCLSVYDWIEKVEKIDDGIKIFLRQKENAKFIPKILLNAKVDFYEMKALGTIEDVFTEMMTDRR